MFFVVFQILIPIPAIWFSIPFGDLLTPLFHAALVYILLITTSPITRILTYFIYQTPKFPEYTQDSYAEDIEETSAGLGSRVAAGFIDLIIFGTGFFMVFEMLFRFYSDEGGVYVNMLDMDFYGWLVTVLAFFLTFVIYNVYFEVNEHGKTIGKAIMGLRVVSQNSEKLRPGQSVSRNFFRMLDLPGIGFFMMLAKPERLRLGDSLSETKVIFQKRPKRRTDVDKGEEYPEEDTEYENFDEDGNDEQNDEKYQDIGQNFDELSE